MRHTRPKTHPKTHPKTDSKTYPNTHPTNHPKTHPQTHPKTHPKTPLQNKTFDRVLRGYPPCLSFLPVLSSCLSSCLAVKYLSIKVFRATALGGAFSRLSPIHRTTKEFLEKIILTISYDLVVSNAGGAVGGVLRIRYRQGGLI